ncbi:MAG TPA: DNA repair protein RadC [Candidatus Paceibacterota bacterium]|nr:DNA repair protein RadC [Candidatus Paceibacterota bacterium]
MNTYSIPNLDKLITLDIPEGQERTYVYRLRDLPEADRPREKLLAHGPGGLSIVELVAIILNTGTTKEDVLSMASRIIREYGEKSFASLDDPKKMSTDLDIPLVKACQVVASSELGRRFYKKPGGRNVAIRNAKDVSNYVRDMHELPKEYLRGIYLNNHHRVVHDEVLSMGTLDANIIHPREVFKPALEYGASAVILVHNHPSGFVTPSTSDIEITRQLIDAGKIMGVSLIDHVVVGKGKYMSIPAIYQE